MTNKGNTSSFAPSRHNIAVKVAAVLAPVVLLIGAYFIYDASVGSGKMLYAEADYGETVKCELADGTVVWLNAGSSLEYPSRFGGGKRQVKLDGEGYFNVTSNRRKPFVVVSDNLRTEVVGTEFNICSYDNHRHESVTVLSGEVNVFTKGDRKFNLSPDEHLVHWKSGGSTDVTQVDAPVMISWMNKGLVFENSTVEDILMGLQRTYDLRVMADPNYLTGTQYSVKFVNGESLYEILSVIRKLTGVPCRLAGGTLFMGDNTGGLYELDGRK